jgi:hypothetical protein
MPLCSRSVMGTIMAVTGAARDEARLAGQYEKLADET